MDRRNFLEKSLTATAAKVVEQVCNDLDPDRYFIPSAPCGGVNANDPREGSTNGYTNMWFIPGYDYDSWPEINSGKVDYFLEPYHVYYTLRAAYAPVILSPTLNVVAFFPMPDWI